MRFLKKSRIQFANGSRNRFFFRYNHRHMAKNTYTISKKFIAYGHYLLTVENEGEVKSAITDNTDLICRLNSEVENERVEAEQEVIRYVFRISH